MGDRFNILSQMEHLQSKYMGTGHADSTKFEWAAHQHRDTFASLMGHQEKLANQWVKCSKEKICSDWMPGFSGFESLIAAHYIKWEWLPLKHPKNCEIKWLMVWDHYSKSYRALGKVFPAQPPIVSHYI